ncbi:MAG: hypothetical protein ACRDZO_07705 [Egibacteraceae bacterium]
MSESNANYPASERVERVSDGVHVFTPCHDAEVFFPAEQAVSGARLRLLCQEGGEGWLCELVADEQAESGLRAVWTEPPASEADVELGSERHAGAR